MLNPGSLMWSFALVLFISSHPRSICGRTIFETNAISKSNSSDWEDIIYVEPEGCKVFCYGPLLHSVQMARLFPDSKTFVDMKLKFTPEKTSVDFAEFLLDKDQQPTEGELKRFVDAYFEDLGKEFEPWTPSDWKEKPAFLKRINDPDLRQWGSDLNEIWLELGRKMITEVHDNPQYYSIIPVQYPVIIPGGRFIEFYYWDSYWIIKGLLYCEMTNTALGMLKNFVSIVKRFGFIPNGGRIYYSKRSQPPLLGSMVDAFCRFTKDDTLAFDSLQYLEHEFEYWINNHSIEIKGHTVFRYGDSSSGPRPEAYREDIETAEDYLDNESKEDVYSELKAAAESGMDFSSRWFINKKGTIEGTLKDLKTRSIIPVDLNAMLYKYAKIIAYYYDKKGNDRKKQEYEKKAENILNAIDAVLWNSEAGIWLDYDIINNKPRNYYVASNFAPLWMEAYRKEKTAYLSDSVMNYIKQLKLDSYPGGVPNTLYRTGEQWDYPNVWAPMQYLLVEGLKNLGTEEAVQMSKKWAHRWVKSNFEAYRQSRAMFEKYDAERFGGFGGGGEYGVQTGFGWSNGVIIEYLAEYGDQLSVSNSNKAPATTISISLSLLLAIVAIVAKLM